MMSQESLRFKKARASAAQSACVEVAHTLGHVRDSKAPGGPVLAGDMRALVAAVKGGAFSS
jgi:hypothetical protein